MFERSLPFEHHFNGQAESFCFGPSPSKRPKRNHYQQNHQKSDATFVHPIESVYNVQYTKNKLVFAASSDLNSKAATEVWIKALPIRLIELKQRPSILGSEHFEDGNRTVKRCHCSVIWNYHCSTNNAPFLRKSILTIHLHCLI